MKHQQRNVILGFRQKQNPFIFFTQKITIEIQKKRYYQNTRIKNFLKSKPQAYNEITYSPLIEFKIPDFLNIQRSSFREFLKNGLITEFQKYNSITNSNQTLEVFFYAEHYKLNRPKWTPKQAILKKKSYSCQLYLPIQLSNYQTEEIHLQWVLLANLPLMTKNGHFILNGCPRVLMNQIVRSPGVYFRKVTKNQKIVYSADFIAQRGSWLRLEVDTKKGDIWAKLKKTPKIPIFTFLRSLGLTLPILNNSIDFGKLRYLLQFKEESKSSKKIKEFLGPGINNSLDMVEFRSLLKNLKKYMKPKPPKKTTKKTRKKKIKKWLTPFVCTTYFQSLIELCQKLYPQKKFLELDPKLSQKFLFRKFQNPRTYDLSVLGREKINKKLGLSIPLENTLLTSQDVLFACLFLMDLLQGLVISDDIDDLKNRKIKPSGELIQTQLSTGLIRLEKIIREKLKQPKKDFESFPTLFSVKPLNQSFRDFFGTSPLSQLMDQTNALSEITHKRRLSSLGPGGINRETAGMAIRGIHPTHYGRICPIETPEGQNAGLVNSFTILSHLNNKSFIETPFYKTYKGFILKNKNPFLFSSDQERNLVLAPGDIKTSLFNFLPAGVRIPSRQFKEFKRVSRNEIHFIAVSPIQMISIATSLIPFLEHNDGNRALMGSNMQRQAVPTLRPSKPIVGTGLESRVISDVGHGLQVQKSGFVSYVDGNKVIVYSKKRTYQNLFFANKKPDFQIKKTGFLNLYSKQKNTRRSSFKKKLVKSANVLKSKLCLNWPNGKARAANLRTLVSRLRQGGNQITQLSKIKNKNGIKSCEQRFPFELQSKPQNFSSLLNYLTQEENKIWVRDFSFILFAQKRSHFEVNKKSFTLPDGKAGAQKFFKKINQYNFLNYYKREENNLYSNFSIIPFQLRLKENYLNSKQLSCLSNSLFLNDFGGQFQLLKFFSKKVFYSKLTINFKPFLSKRSLLLINKFSHQKILLSYCKIILIHFYIKLNKTTTKNFRSNPKPPFKLRKHPKTIPIGNVPQKSGISHKHQIENPFWYNSFPLFLSKPSPLTPLLFSRPLFSKPAPLHLMQSFKNIDSRTESTICSLSLPDYGKDQKVSSNQKLQKQNLTFVKTSNFKIKNEKFFFPLKNKGKLDQFFFTENLLAVVRRLRQRPFENGKIMTNKFYLKFSRLLKHQKNVFSNRKIGAENKTFTKSLTSQKKGFFFLKKRTDLHFQTSKSLNADLFLMKSPYQYFECSPFIFGMANKTKKQLAIFKNPFLFWCLTRTLYSLKAFSKDPDHLKNTNVKKKFQTIYNEKKKKNFQILPNFAEWQSKGGKARATNKNFFLPLFSDKTKLNFSFNSLLFQVSYPVQKQSNFIVSNLTSQELKQNSKKFIKSLVKLKTFSRKFVFNFCPICLKRNTLSSIKSSGKNSEKNFQFCPCFAALALPLGKVRQSFCFSVKKSAPYRLQTADKTLKTLSKMSNSNSLLKFGISENFKSDLYLSQTAAKTLPSGKAWWSEKSFSIKTTDENSTFDQENFAWDAKLRQPFDSNKLSPLFDNSLIPQSYTLNKYHRSNQDTYMIHRPIVQEGQWVEKGDILADSSVSVQGELSIGQNILVGYIPWEGYNFEDAVLISERLIFDDLYTSLHIERYEVEIRDTQFGLEQITNQIPNEKYYDSIDHNGIAKIGSWVKEGDILVGKVAPIGQKKLTAYENLLYDILNKEIPKTRDTSLRVPRGVTGRVIHVEIVETGQKKETDFFVSSKSLNFPQKKKLKKVTPYEYLYKVKIKKDQKVQSFCLKKKFEKRFSSKVSTDFNKGEKNLPNFAEWQSKGGKAGAQSQKRKPTFFSLKKRNRDFNLNRKRWLDKEMYFFKEKEKININTLRTKVEALGKKNISFPKILKIRLSLLQKALTGNLKIENFFEDKFWNSIKHSNRNFYKHGSQEEKKKKSDETQLYNPLKSPKTSVPKSFQKTNFSGPQKVHIYLAEKRKLQIGDKIAGRHGNKGIISNILPRQDMPYLSDGTPLDIVLNPLGVPSRMNVGQIFECLLGMAGYYLKQNYKIQPFDEIYGCEASRSLVYSKLYEARIKTGQDWLFNSNHPGKTRLFDGRTGDCFKQPVTVGVAYILKLIHLVDDKIHARSTGPYSLVTQQPLRGRSKQGGQRVGEMEVWALEGFGAAYILQEILTIKSDDLKGRNQVMNSILNNKPVNFGLPESFKVLVRELQSLCLDIAIYRYGENGTPTKININKFW